MSYRWIACLALIASPGIALAQEPAEALATVIDATFSEVKLLDGPIYQIEFLIAQGDVTAFEQAASRNLPVRDPVAPNAALNPPVPVASPAADPDAHLRATPPATFPHPVPDAKAQVDPVDLRDLVPAAPHIDVLAAPRVSVVAGQEAMVQVGSRATFEYLEPAGDETFRLRKSEPCDLGILMKVTVAPAEDDPQGVVISPLQIEVTSLDGREPVKGIGLEVGKPIVSSRSLKTTVRARLGEARTVAIPSGPNREAGMILRVTRMELDEEKEPLKLEVSPAR